MNILPSQVDHNSLSTCGSLVSEMSAMTAHAQKILLAKQVAAAWEACIMA